MMSASDGSRFPRLVLPVVAYGVLLVAALQSLVVPVLANITASLHSTANATSWVVTANLLAAAVLTPILGRLGDLRGRRLVLLAVLAVVLVGSVLAATTDNLPLLLLARVLQGSSFALFPLGIGVLRDELPPQRLTGAMAIVSGTLAIGAGFGLVATGLLTRDGADYHRVFWLATVLSVIGIVGVLFAVPRRRPAAEGSTDWAGAGILGVALVLLLMPLAQGNNWGWGSARVIGSLVGAVLAFTIFVLFERRLTHPLVSVRMLTHRPLVVANLAGLFLGISLFVVFLTVSSFVQAPHALAGYGFGSTVLAASVVYLLPGAAAGIVTAPLGGRLVARYGARTTLVVSLLLAGLGFLSLVVLHSASWQVIVGSFAVNTAVTFGYAALPALLVEHVGLAETGIANSVNSIARSIGGSVASALVVTLLTRNLIDGTPVPLPHESQYVIILAIAAVGAALGAALVAFGLPGGRRGTLTAAQVEVDEVLGAAGLDIPRSDGLTRSR
ncbi:putative MFS family arabinose efflux permease [Micromonospora pisi]|uniref:Putative MFS family arabinose efflux permease n=1 Tax=Micromonospora pisi TaxID=589240 RepID=A0A495JA97_9ACTN|nr:MFS transporter [Micromonospora pisi]RKR85946.1 putative MFS family arabinose efflux permease [Micromonospora pisi]